MYRIFCYHYLRKDLFYANSIIRTFYLQKASAFLFAFYYYDDFYFHLQCGRRAFCTNFVGKTALAAINLTLPILMGLSALGF